MKLATSIACEVAVLTAICGAPVAGQPNDDPAVAFTAEVEAVLSGQPRVQALRALVDRWAANDPDAAARAVESLARSGDSSLLREGLGEIAGRRWAERDPDSAVDWAVRLGELGVWSGVLAGLTPSGRWPSLPPFQVVLARKWSTW